MLREGFLEAVSKVRLVLLSCNHDGTERGCSASFGSRSSLHSR
jgi:hypothetical protein